MKRFFNIFNIYFLLYVLVVIWFASPEFRFRYYETKWKIYWFVHDLISGPDYKWGDPSERPDPPVNFKLEIEPDPKPVYNKHYQKA